MPFGGRENALTYLPQLIEEGLANTQIVNFLKEQGFGYRTQQMFADINRLRLENMGSSFIPSLSPGETVPERFMRTWEGDTEYKYRVVVKFEYRVKDTGEEKTAATVFYFDEQPTPEEVAELWEARSENLGDSPPGVDEIYGAINTYYYKNVTPKGGT